MKQIRFMTLIIKTSSILLILAMVGCSINRGPLVLYKGKLPAHLKVADGVKVLKIDEQMVDTKFFSEALLADGKHEIIVHLKHWDKGSIFFLDTSLTGGHSYIAKFEVLDRKGFSNTWGLDVWIEDVETGERMSNITRNL